MQGMWRKIWSLVRSEKGPTSVEYAVMLALIILVCFTAISTIGSPTTSSFNSVVAKGGFS